METDASQVPSLSFSIAIEECSYHGTESIEKSTPSVGGGGGSQGGKEGRGGGGSGGRKEEKEEEEEEKAGIVGVSAALQLGANPGKHVEGGWRKCDFHSRMENLNILNLFEDEDEGGWLGAVKW